MRFSKKEITDLLKAWILISIAFSILYRKMSGSDYFLVFIVSAFTAGLGFLLHELAHKFIAQRYGYHAEFHAFDFMLFFAILSSFLGFILAAPGAVFIHGDITKRKNGIISLAGPLTNMILAVLFLIMLKLNLFTLISNLGFRINSYLALFNMLPFFAFDGHKVFEWNKIVFSIAIIFSFILVFFQFV